MLKNLNRRSFLKKSIMASTTAGLGLSCEEKVLLERATTKSTVQPVQEGTAKLLPTGRIGNVKISRLITGGNLISSFAHSRDLRRPESTPRYYGLIATASAFSKNTGTKEAARYSGLHRSNPQKLTSNTFRPI